MRILTQRGDVLILRTEQSFTIYAVGRVANDGQEDFRGEMNVEYVIDYAAAVAEAKRLVVSGRRILFGTSTPAIGRRSQTESLLAAT